MKLALLAFLLMLRPDQVEWMKADWTRPVKHLLGVNQWEGQKRVVRSLQKHRRLAVMSGHKVGKTHLIGSLVNVLLPLYGKARIITSASTGDQLTENVWGEIRDQRSNARRDLGGILMPQANEWRMGPHWYAKGIATKDPDSFQGKHSEQGIVVVVLDECQAIDRKIVTAAKSMTSDLNGYLMAIANPTIPSGWFYDACTSDPTWHVEKLSCYDHPNIVEGRKVMPGPTMDLIRTFEGTPDEGPRLRGEFNEEGGDRLITMASLRGVMSVLASQLEKDRPHMGVDIADQGGDECVAVVSKGSRVVHQESWISKGKDGLMQTAGRIRQVAHEHEVAAEDAHVDGIGVGAGVVARLHESGFPCDDVQFGAGPVGDWAELHGDYIEFANRRAELYWTARVLIEQQKVEIPERFREIHADLAAPGWGFLSDRKVKIEAKDKIKERIGRSPDCGDAFVLSLSRTSRLMPAFARLR